ncbi:hypothetical protein Q4Q39_16455 [Flavivirga amylovorans]|uniref:HTH domain-containing protein n=1 Tax=Flavivirga amylovorans TaxID=870486 RepID=A0ABT8X4V1_9FLAO|nr:hypothetical protein [Flavivirga amylovorans]MDO5988997.1 hypothetical protein [Flavivirga amylovorans]
MSLHKYINRVEQLDQLIRLESTGSPEECAKKLSISKRSLYSLIDELKKDFKCPIIYNRSRRSYIYTKKGRISNLIFEVKS